MGQGKYFALYRPGTSTKRITFCFSFLWCQVLYIQAFVLVFLLGKFMGKVFFGQLRAAEMEVSPVGGLTFPGPVGGAENCRHYRKIVGIMERGRTSRLWVLCLGRICGLGGEMVVLTLSLPSLCVSPHAIIILCIDDGYFNWVRLCQTLLPGIKETTSVVLLCHPKCRPSSCRFLSLLTVS